MTAMSQGCWKTMAATAMTTTPPATSRAETSLTGFGNENTLLTIAAPYQMGEHLWWRFCSAPGGLSTTGTAGSPGFPIDTIGNSATCGGATKACPTRSEEHTSE